MANIKKIKAGNTNYDIDATYWGGKTSSDIKTINGKKILKDNVNDTGNIDINDVYVWNVSALPIADTQEVPAGLLKDVLNSYNSGKPIFIFDGYNTLPTFVNYISDDINDIKVSIIPYTSSNDNTNYNTWSYYMFSISVLDCDDDDYFPLDFGGTGVAKVPFDTQLLTESQVLVYKGVITNDTTIKSPQYGYVSNSSNGGAAGPILSFGHPSYQIQLQSKYDGLTPLRWRSLKDGSFTTWKKILDENNFADYAIPNDPIVLSESELEGTEIPFARVYGVQLGGYTSDCIVHTMIIDSFRKQIAYCVDNTNRIFVRHYMDEWSEWVEIPTSLKTINGQSLTGSGDISITSTQSISLDEIDLMLTTFDNIGCVSSGNGISESLVEETDGE